MANTVKLKVTDRINIFNQAQKLGCTWPVRCAFDAFIDSVSVSDEEYERAKVHRGDDGKFVADNDFEIDYDKDLVPKAIKEAIEQNIINLEEASLRTQGMKPMYEDVKAGLGLLVDVDEL